MYRNSASGDDLWIWLIILFGVTCVPFIAIPIILIWLGVSSLK